LNQSVYIRQTYVVYRLWFVYSCVLTTFDKDDDDDDDDDGDDDDDICYLVCLLFASLYCPAWMVNKHRDVISFHNFYTFYF